MQNVFENLILVNSTKKSNFILTHNYHDRSPELREIIFLNLLQENIENRLAFIQITEERKHEKIDTW